MGDNSTQKPRRGSLAYYQALFGNNEGDVTTQPPQRTQTQRVYQTTQQHVSANRTQTQLRHVPYEHVGAYNVGDREFKLMVGRDGTVGWGLPHSGLVFTQYRTNGHPDKKQPITRRAMTPSEVAEMLGRVISFATTQPVPSLDEILKAEEPLIRQILRDLYYFRGKPSAALTYH